MLTRLWCWLFGHKFWEQAATGNYIEVTDPVTYTTVKKALYRWELQSHCVRCETPEPTKGGK